MIRNVLMIIIMTALTVGCFWLSHYYSNREQVVLGGFQDCSWVHTIPGPSNCADSQTMGIVDELRFKTFIFNLCGLVFILAYIAVLIITGRKEPDLSKANSESFLNMT